MVLIVSHAFACGPVYDVLCGVMESSLLVSLLLFVIPTTFLVITFLLFLEKRRNWVLKGELSTVRQEGSLHEEKLTILSEAAFEGIVLLEDGICLLMNSRAEQIFGYSASEVIGRPTTLLIAEKDRGEVRRNIDNQYDLPYEVEGRRSDGTTFPLAIYGKSVEYQGRVVRAAALRDLTLWKIKDEERKLLEERLERSRKMESLGLMASGVAHDLNNILSGLVTYPEFLLLNMTTDDPMFEPLKAIHRAGERAAEVVADLLTVARGAAMVIKPESLNTLVRSYLGSPEYDNLMRRYPDVTVRSELDENVANITGSAVHVGKCLMNLVTNGIEAIQGGGGVVIRTYPAVVDERLAGEIEVEPGVFSVLEVSDSGPGIMDEDREHIFEPFYSRKDVGRSGTGLGLAIVWNTMKNHGGGVSLDSSGSGSSFRLYFRTTSEEVGEPGEVDSLPERGRGEVVLIVDDESCQLKIAGTILRELGYRVETVASGEEAVAWLQEREADIVLLDMMLGHGMNGYETYREVVRFRPGQKAIIASGYSENDEVRNALACGAGMYIRKPYSVAQLGNAVETVLRKG